MNPAVRPESDVLIITDPDQDRYASPRLIGWWEQARLANAQVMVVGAGALGNEVLKNLALLGIGRVLIVDFDKVEVSNLGRAVLFRKADAGRPKVEVAVERMQRLNPDVRPRALFGDIVRDVGLGVFRRMDVVIGCLDNREARWAVNRACWQLGVPWIDGGLEVLNGTVKTFIPPEGACYECGLTEQDWQLMTLRYSCPGLKPEDIMQGRMPTTITSAAIIAGVQSQEALKLLHDLPITPGSGFLYDGLRAGALKVQLTRRADCLAHRMCAPIIELPGGARSLTLADLLRAAQQHLGPKASIELDREVITRLTCMHCGASEPVMRAYLKDQPIESACLQCGRPRYPELTHVIKSDMFGLDVILTAIGVPLLHILEARTDDQSVYLELTGDRDEVLNY